MSKRYKFNPSPALKRFLYPELAARDGEISDTWDKELMALFPDCFKEIKDEPKTFNEWFIQQKPDGYGNSDLKPLFDVETLKDCHKWTIDQMMNLSIKNDNQYDTYMKELYGQEFWLRDDYDSGDMYNLFKWSVK